MRCSRDMWMAWYESFDGTNRWLFTAVGSTRSACETAMAEQLVEHKFNEAQVGKILTKMFISEIRPRMHGFTHKLHIKGI